MRFFYFTALFIISSRLYSQGCSDAGFCTMGAMKPDQNYNKQINFKLRSVEFNYYHGKTLLTPIVTVLTADMSFAVTERYSVQVKVPYQMVHGDLGQTQGMGDLSLSATRSLPLKNGYNLGLTLGGKIPSGKSNKEADGKFSSGDLPMYYQTSLGTYDLVAGASALNDKWLFATGIQVPVIHQNENDFRWGQWKEYPDQDYVNKYPLSNDLKRGTDVMLRAERNFRHINYNFGLGVLAIYRVSKDERYNFNTNERFKIDGTTGMALNVLGNFGYNLNINNSFKIIMGLKLKDREINPDGLTRKHVISASYVYRF